MAQVGAGPDYSAHAARLADASLRYPNNLPLQLNAFIGRERELRELKSRLWSTRLLTLTGPGGCGKTRIALQVATDLLDAFSDGVWLIELAALSDAALIPRAIVTVLGTREQATQSPLATLIDFLRPRELLLILDNCEHLIAACAQLTTALLSACPDVRILATSREALNVTGEQAWLMPSLAMPDPTTPQTAQTLVSYEAVSLFIDRAAAAAPAFTLSEANASAIAQICQRLDGLPLAIELAAARVKVLSVEQIAARLDDRFNLLTGGSRTAAPRQQTLRATIDWSHELLSGAERTLFRQLSVCVGGWTLDAAQAIGAADLHMDGLDVVTQLVNKSLVIAEERHGEMRYRMLDTIRQYARMGLIEAREIEATRDRHLQFYRHFAGQAEPQFFGAQQVAWFNRTDLELDNLRAALDWSLMGGADNPEKLAAGLRLATALMAFWDSRGHYVEGGEWLRRLFDRAERVPSLAATRNAALYAVGVLHWSQGDFVNARSRLEQALAIGRELNDPELIAKALRVLGSVALSEGDFEQARSHLEQSLSIWREQHFVDSEGLTWPLIALGGAALLQGDYPHAQSWLEEAVALLRDRHDDNELAYAARRLGQVAQHRGNYQRAIELCHESLNLNLKVGSQRGVAAALAALAGIYTAQEHDWWAVLLFGATQALLDDTGETLAPVDGTEFTAHLAGVRARLAPTAFDTAWTEGYGLSIDQAAAYALTEPATAPSINPARSMKQNYSGLTVREREVARLIAHGKSNRELAEALVVEVKTVEAHVTRILNKLGFDNRVQIATWAVDKGLAQPATPDP